ncbi:growth arrest and DNA damage-inducible protein GADD45 alpha-like [Lingula anatina]|uniref:Growth arrest and DNA damage-inducible protein GADD45 alpha-like n=1 Tax=Lingula anatina TaxID=7574 RepID=A0A1S3J875_LINAN|nr:growth arrest and DNA damage-inducible protein GADD45 alpha-like [Lingula anatina]|eukprot:XP_013406064.1 growth arrest and DNA damage-inducible protein GADD45 alpha-like [Lingula anatina]
MGYQESLRTISYLQMNNNNNGMTLHGVGRSTLTTRPNAISVSLQLSLQEAKETNRVTCGVYQAARRLEESSDHVMLCVLAADTLDNLELCIHFTLLEAYCWENDIQVIKVDSATKLGKLLLGDSLPANDNDFAAGRSNNAQSLDCALVEFSKENNSPADEEVLTFSKASEGVLPRPVIDLPE